MLGKIPLLHCPLPALQQYTLPCTMLHCALCIAALMGQCSKDQGTSPTAMQSSLHEALCPDTKAGDWYSLSGCLCVGLVTAQSYISRSSLWECPENEIIWTRAVRLVFMDLCQRPTTPGEFLMRALRLGDCKFRTSAIHCIHLCAC